MKSGGKRMLVVLAHPDDETVMGGTIARYAGQGVQVTLICTTNGGGGSAPVGITPKELTRVRKEELLAACRVLGVSRVEFFEDRHSFPFHLDRKNYAQVKEQHRAWVSEIMEAERPEVVLTFGPEGVTGHETHIMVGSLTTEAVDHDTFGPRLYYIAFSPAQVEGLQRWFARNAAILQAYAEEVKRKPNLGSPTPLLYSVPEEEISTTINIGDSLLIKREAIRCHLTQGGGGGILDVFGDAATECFVRAMPRVARSEPRETDLFGHS